MAWTSALHKICRGENLELCSVIAITNRPTDPENLTKLTFINCCRVVCETWRFVTRDDILSHEGRRPECDNVNRI